MKSDAPNYAEQSRTSRSVHLHSMISAWILLDSTNVSDDVRFARKSVAVVGSRIAPKARLALTTPINLVAPLLPIALVSASNSMVHFAAESRPSSVRGKMTVRYALTIPVMIAP